MLRQMDPWKKPSEPQSCGDTQPQRAWMFELRVFEQDTICILKRFFTKFIFFTCNGKFFLP